MLEQLRARTKLFLWIVAIAFIISIGAGSIFGGGRRGSGTPPQQGIIGVVDGTSITYQNFNEDFRSRLAAYAEQTGSNISDATRDAIRNETWNSLVTNILVDKEITRLGIDVPNDAVFDAIWNNPPSSIMQSPAFQDEQGNFSFDEYHRQIQLHPERWEALADYYKEAIQRQILQQEIQSAAMITDNELWDEFVAANAKVRVSYVSVDPRMISRQPLIPTEQEARDYYQAHKTDFERPATALLKYVAFEKKASKEDEEDAYLRLEDLAVAIRGGEDFAELARIYSQAPDAQDGGDMGFVSRDKLPAELQDAAFSLGIGEVSDPIKTSTGFVIITVEGKKTVDGEPQVHLARITVQNEPSEETLVGIEDEMRSFADEAKKDGIVKAAEKLGYTVETTPPFTDERFIPGVGDLRPAVTLTFQNKPGAVIGPFVTPDAYYVFEVAERNPSYVPTYDQLSAEAAESGGENPAITALIRQRQSDKAMEIADQIAKAVSSGKTLGEAADAVGQRVSVTANFSRRDYVPGVGRGGAFVGTSFALAPGQTSGVVHGQNPDRYYVLRVDEKIPASQEAFAEQEATLRQQLLQREQMELFSSWLQDLQAKANIKDYRDSFF